MMKIIRALVIDDSAHSRRTITKLLEMIPEVEVAGYAINGESGIRKVLELKPDLVTLDLEMPGMDGFAVIRLLMARFPVPIIIISSAQSSDNVFKALELGALDFIAKPTSRASDELYAIQEELHRKVSQLFSLSPVALKNRSQATSSAVVPAAAGGPPFPDMARGSFDLLAIGASTGGPPALQQLFSSFSQRYPFAAVVSQHMPSGFTKTFAERLNRASCFDVKEAVDGDQVTPGSVLIAPGGSNLVLERSGEGGAVARIIPPSATDRYIPSVDAMLASCAALYRKRLLTVILTGMGNDGCRGICAVKESGGRVIAESSESAVVFGMPREAAATGMVDKVVALNNLAQEIIQHGNFY